MGKDTDPITSATELEDGDFIHDSVGSSMEDLKAEFAADAAARDAAKPKDDKAGEQDDETEGNTETPATGSPDPKAEKEPAKAEEPKKPSPRTPEGKLETLQAQINQLTREKHKTAADRDAAKAELADLQSRAAALRAEIEDKGEKKDEKKADAAPPKVERKPEPQEDDFEDFRDWVKAHAAWTKEEAKLDAQEVIAAERARVSSESKEAQEKAQQEAYVAQRQQLFTEHKARVEAYSLANPEFAKLMEEAGALPTNPMIDEHILHSKNGPALMRYLAEHPDECETIAGLGPGPTLVALGEIEGEIKRTAKDAAKSGSAPKPKPVTRAAPPVNPVGGGAAVVNDDDDGSPLDLEFGPEYVRRMNARDKARSRSSRL